MLADRGIVMVFVWRLTDCPAVSVYGPLGSAADCNMIAEGDILDDCVRPAAAELGTVIVWESRVTAPFRANSLPSTVAPVVAVIEVKARMVPFMTEVVTRVAELPTCQKMLAALAPPL